MPPTPLVRVHLVEHIFDCNNWEGRIRYAEWCTRNQVVLHINFEVGLASNVAYHLENCFCSIKID